MMLWVCFYIAVLFMLGIDLFAFGRKGQHEVSIRESLTMTAVWIGVSLMFGLGIYLFYPNGAEMSMQFLTGYLIEKSLSMDNLFVFLTIFSVMGISKKYQHEVLFWGIIGALVLRSVFIFLGAEIVSRFEWVLGIFGVILLYLGYTQFHEHEENAEQPKLLKWAQKNLSFVTDHQGKFFLKKDGKLVWTSLFVTLLIIELSDLIFAVDSIPAIFSVSRDPFIVLTSNIFAILGLRALYFTLADLSHWLQHLNFAIGIILIFVGVKILLDIFGILTIPTYFSLIFIFVCFISVFLAERKTDSWTPF